MDSFYKQICFEDALTEFGPLIESGNYMLNPKDHKIWNIAELDLVQGTVKPLYNKSTVWVYVNPNEGLNCTWWKDIGDVFKYIPTNCRDCWKVVVRPSTVVELIKVYMMQLKMAEEDSSCYCKCGIETRPYVFGNYGAYFYTRSMEDGLERKRQVRQMVDEYVGKHVSVVLKRSCTEFELAHGPSDKYVQPEEAKRWEYLAEKYCAIEVLDKKYLVQSELEKRKVIREWMKHSWSVGDKSVYQLTNGQPLATPVVTYKHKDK